MEHSVWKSAKKSHLIILHTLFVESNFCPKIQFWQNPNHFHEFFVPNFFLYNFSSWNQSCQQLKVQTTTFHEFSPKNRQFLGKSKLNFGQKIISRHDLNFVTVLLAAIWTPALLFRQASACALQRSVTFVLSEVILSYLAFFKTFHWINDNSRNK